MAAFCCDAPKGGRRAAGATGRGRAAAGDAGGPGPTFLRRGLPGPREEDVRDQTWEKGVSIGKAQRESPVLSSYDSHQSSCSSYIQNFKTLIPMNVANIQSTQGAAMVGKRFVRLKARGNPSEYT